MSKRVRKSNFFTVLESEGEVQSVADAQYRRAAYTDYKEFLTRPVDACKRKREVLCFRVRRPMVGLALTTLLIPLVCFCC